jgi:hypothetical protein
MFQNRPAREGRLELLLRHFGGTACPTDHHGLAVRLQDTLEAAPRARRFGKALLEQGIDGNDALLGGGPESGDRPIAPIRLKLVPEPGVVAMNCRPAHLC